MVVVGESSMGCHHFHVEFQLILSPMLHVTCVSIESSRINVFKLPRVFAFNCHLILNDFIVEGEKLAFVFLGKTWSLCIF